MMDILRAWAIQKMSISPLRLVKLLRSVCFTSEFSPTLLRDDLSTVSLGRMDGLRYRVLRNFRAPPLKALPLLSLLIEMPQVRRLLSLAGGHQQPIGPDKIVLVVDHDVDVVFGADSLAPRGRLG